MWNVINVEIDAYRILKNKTIAHWVNFCGYGVLVATLVWFREYDFKSIILVALSAFFNRQFSFDIFLNLRRGLDWFYQTKATGTKASLLDRVERFIFGSSDLVGIKIAIVYFVLYGNIIAFHFYSK